MADAGKKSAWVADIYANEYIPQALTAVNDSPAIIVPPSIAMELNFEAYIAKYAGSQFLKTLPKADRPLYSGSTELQSSASLNSDTYGQFFSDCITLETTAQVDEMIRHALFGVGLTIVPRQLNMFNLRVPGLRDGTPTIILGQIVLLRQLLLDPITKLPQGMDAWLRPGGLAERGVPAPGFTGMEIQATVYAIDRVHEVIVLHTQGLMTQIPLVCNVGFLVPQKLSEGLHRAIHVAARDLYAGPGSWLQRMLFPEEKHGLTRKTLPSAVFDIEWYDEKLNHEQKKFVDATIKRNYGELPFLLYGPPGSGKTKTVCELALQLARDTDFKGSILLCAPSDPAADTLAYRLSSHLDPEDMFRMNDCSRTFAEVPNTLLSYCFIEDNMFSLPSPAMLLKKKIVVTTCRDADMLVQARMTNRDIASFQRDITKTMYPFHESPSTLPCHWLALIIDEAAQATEPETVIPMTIVSPHPKCNSGPSPLFAMAGDEHQLNAKITNPSTALKVSLFERIAKSPLFALHPLARGNTQQRPKDDSFIHPPFINLARNYRSHSAIVALPSALFYNNTLIPEATDVYSLLPWHKWKGHGWPVLFSCNDGTDESETLHNSGTGWYNAREIDKALAYAQDLLGSGLSIEQNEICIMSPFQAQVRRLRQRARERNLYSLNIGPMEAFQGLESRVVIICTTRARKRFLKDDEDKAIGIIGNEKKFNVAVTRAKEGLIVIGNPWAMSTNYYWDQFLRFCYRNELWETDDKNDDQIQSQQGENTDEWQPSQCDGVNEIDQSGMLTSFERALILSEKDRLSLRGTRARALGRHNSNNAEDSVWQSGIDAEQRLDQSVGAP